MEKIGILKNEKIGDYEKENGFASYRTIIERYVGDIVLCNNIYEIDESVYDNMNENGIEYYNIETGEEETKEAYEKDDDAIIETRPVELYQFYLCNIGEYQEEQLTKIGIILSYSDLLDCDVLCVDHYGTSWDYVLTNVKLFDTYEELKAYEEGESSDEE